MDNAFKILALVILSATLLFFSIAGLVYYFVG